MAWVEADRVLTGPMTNLSGASQYLMFVPSWQQDCTDGGHAALIQIKTGWVALPLVAGWSMQDRLAQLGRFLYHLAQPFRGCPAAG